MMSESRSFDPKTEHRGKHHHNDAQTFIGGHTQHPPADVNASRFHPQRVLSLSPRRSA